jgi:ketosteroid isomerase-like protein
MLRSTMKNTQILKGQSIIIVLLAALIISSASFSCSTGMNTSLTAEEKKTIASEVRKAFEQLVESSKLLNKDAYLQHFDNEIFTGIYSGGEIFQNIDEFARFYDASINSIKGYISLEFDSVKITVINREVAILINQYTAKVLLDSGEEVEGSGAGSQVWNKQGDTWKLVSVSGS